MQVVVEVWRVGLPVFRSQLHSVRTSFNWYFQFLINLMIDLLGWIVIKVFAKNGTVSDGK